MNDNVITISDLNKEYKMFSRKKDRLLETVFPWYKRHNVFKAMNNLNLDLKKGDVLGILGRNGAGKSTLLKMITGVVTPTSGSIEVKGKISSLLELGTAFNPDLTGLENIYQHGQIMGLTNNEIKEKQQEIIDFADIGEHLYQPVKTYSSGMFARLAFACAINVEPDVLIVDEVLSVGDMSFQLKCFKKFEQFKKAGRTIIFVTHNISDVLRNCTRTIIIDDGKKVFDGDVKDGVEKYKKIIVGMSVEDSKKGIATDDEEIKDNNNYLEKEKVSSTELWMDKFIQNENIIDYGNGKAKVIDYGIFDTENNFLPILENDKEVIFKSKTLFNDDVSDPIFTMTIKDFKGLEMCGNNSLIEKVITGKFRKGEIAVAEFKQIIPLRPGKYTLSFSCTRYNPNGEIEVLNRKYDALLIEILSAKDCVGLFSIDSKIVVNKI